MNYNETLIWLSSIKNVNSKTIDDIESYLGNLELIWEVDINEIKHKCKFSNDTANDIINHKNNKYIELLFDKLSKGNIKTISIKDKDYPTRLKNIYSPPKILYFKGDILEKDNLSIAIVGSRKATNYGKLVSEKFAKELSNLGITIISGMAIGIDSYAHKGALNNNGRSIAVLGCGVDIIYPKKNMNLYNELINNGAVISEYPIGMQPFPYNFPKRNRIISGLSLGVVVIEAKDKSGSLITTEHALEQGKDVFAVPGNINSIYSYGTNKLIKEGCKPVTDINDILEEVLEFKTMKYDNYKEKIDYSILSDKEEKIVRLVSERPTHFDIISLKTNLSVTELSSILTILEMKKIIKQLPGKLFIVND